MEEEYAQRTSALSSLRAILNDYPLSAGIFRELIQNSEDAGASVQVFVLDHRTHPTAALYENGLAGTQGPALLAFNDAVFGKEDWDALGAMHDSSKSDDSSKIGKYGVGFRSVFNITDSPQILSDTSLAIFDPLRAYLSSEGKKVDLGHVQANHPDQLASFGSLWEQYWTGSVFKGTVVRCPLRQFSSRISGEIVNAATISRLFQDFIKRELGIVLLFLQNIRKVEIREITADGVSTVLAELSITRSHSVSLESHSRTSTVTVNTVTKHTSQRKIWHVLQCSFPQDTAIRLLSQEAQCDDKVLASILKVAKLVPEIGIAADLSPSITGQLFTYLPLPISTGLPVHIHALFAIDSSRRYLKSPNDIGLQPGSRDHTLVQWNRLLLNHYIPQAWRLFLETIVPLRLLSNIFDIWPPENNMRELNAYSPSLPGRILEAAVAAKSRIWPVYNGHNQPAMEHCSLETLISSAPTVKDIILRALANMGLRITRPPQYIFDLISTSNELPILTPDEVHKRLLEHVDNIPLRPEAEQKVVLEFLLSNNNVTNVCGLPLITLTSGRKASLALKDTQPQVIHTMLTRPQFDVFGSCDDESIPLHHLPMQAAEVFRTHGPDLVNVERLEVPRIIEYLTLYPNRLGLELSVARTDPRAVKWLSAFWIWMKTYTHKDELFPQIRHLFLLPSTAGLRTAEVPLFKLRGEHPLYAQPLRSLGFSFLDADFAEAAHQVIASYGLLKSIMDIPVILDSVPPTPSELPSPINCATILTYLARGMNDSVTETQIQRLRSLPIFPILTFLSTQEQTPTVTTNWSSIPCGVSIRSVGRPSFVPTIDGLVFIGLDTITMAQTLMRYLEPNHTNSLLENDLLLLAVDHFATQSQNLQIAALEYMVRNRSKMAPYILDNLKNQSFVPTNDGSLCKPSDVVDPSSPIASLFEGSQSYPRGETTSEVAIIRHLRSLGLMKSLLNIDIFEERVAFIASHYESKESVTLAQNLLALVGRSNLDFSACNLSRDDRWLPTNQGLRSPSKCRDGTQISPLLFDKVLAVLDSSEFTIPRSLMLILGWDQPPPTQIMIEQLDHVLRKGQEVRETAIEILKELGRRDVSSDDLASLKEVTKGRDWIPTTTNSLSDTISAVFSSPIQNSGFYEISYVDAKGKELLRRMGCQDQPTTSLIIGKLMSLQPQPLSVDTLNLAVNLLRSLPEELNEDERSGIFIPDSNSNLRPFSEVYYNDIGEQACLISEDSHFISNPAIDESLAIKLGMLRLGLRYADLRSPGANMGQATITTVRHHLDGYSSQQFLLEFLANAADAGATEFKVALNDVRPSSEHLRVMSSEMEYLHSSPSLVIYNNSTFSDADFDGICRTSIGGKVGRPDTIGEFGLGALTMFHFAEVAIIISGSQVLFMDPSEKHIPLRGRASLILPLNHVQEFYPDHLISVNGLFGFDISKNFYDGTIFLLPLRVVSHLEGKSAADLIVHAFWTLQQVKKDILEPFRATASNCLLFTNMESISSVERVSDGTETLLWSFGVHREHPIVEVEHGLTMTDAKIRDSAGFISSWSIASTSVRENEIPEKFASLKLRRLPFAGLAIRIGEHLPDTGSSHFFSTLPLATPTTLPLHVNASFMLSSDRRQIRFDSYEEIPADYNRWLLARVIPPLYLFVLENLLLAHGDNRRWWPRAKDDDISCHLINGFYSDYLYISSRRVFYNQDHPSQPLTPQEAVLSGEEPPNVHKALSLLRSPRLVSLSHSVREMAKKAGIAKVEPAFVREEILRNPSAITSGLDLKFLEDIIKYLSECKEHLLGLAILPLEDGTFGTINNHSDGAMYYVWKPKDRSRRHNFRRSHFIDPRLKSKELLKLELNISPLDSRSIRALLDDELAGYTDFDALSTEESDWIYGFWDTWDEYVSLGLTNEEILSLPLVPSIRPGRFVSLEQCKQGSVLVMGGRSQTDEQLRTCLDTLDLDIVRLDDDPTPAALQFILKDEFSQLTFETVLRALAQTQRLIDQLFLELDNDLHNAFALWARGAIRDVPNDLLSIASQLPIWSSARSGTATALRPASDVYMLPAGFNLDITANFVEVYVADHPGIRCLQGRQLSYTDLHDKLRLPPILDQTELVTYKRFFDAWSHRLPPTYTNPLPVPTSNLTIRQSNELFARDPLFEAAFGSESENFMHPDFQEFESLLSSHGLRSQDDLDVPMFTSCAEAVENIHDESRVQRASIIFTAYSESLPLRIGADDELSWQQLDDLTFIPRRMETLRKIEGDGDNDIGLEIPGNVTALLDIVSPSDLVRSEYEAIAWSQRACFAVQPHYRALVAHPKLGQPTFAEVIAHLRILSSLRGLSAPQRRILLHDLEETYTYLNDNTAFFRENSPNAETIIGQLRSEDLFLNVDDPTSEPWQWDKADALAFECDDKDGTIRYVRKFLLPFDKILLVAGVLREHHPQYRPSANSSDSESSKLQAIRDGFDRLRKQNSLIDVVFDPAPDEDHSGDSEELVGHRSFLAAFSDYFSSSFSGGYKESREASSTNPVRLDVTEYSRESVQSILDYIYTGSLPISSRSLELLLETLRLAGYWQIMDLFSDIQKEIIVRRLIGPDTLQRIQNIANDNHAEALLAACGEYGENNSEFIQKMRENASGTVS